MSDFPGVLRKSAGDSGSVVCMGMDPVLERIPVPVQGAEGKIVKFYSDMLDSVSGSISAVKPNYAFFAQYRFPGLRALKKLIAYAKGKGLPVILDAKRGDIGISSMAYAVEAFGFWKADAVTLSPYMGFDSLEPFFGWCSRGKGAYVLVRTSNAGASDFQGQGQDSGGKKLYMRVAGKVIEWHKPGVGAVVGATSIQELGEVAGFFRSSGKDVPLLVPGVGSQGGSAAEVAACLSSAGYELGVCRINSSSSVSYAFERFKTEDYAGAALRAVKELNGEVGEIG